ncbi:unnamed protein product [Blepharisma stoltei]|uniref:Uncharacterized protein n=1 Tax=Blepharisma stoltei TaxID=1481888 RepID=A0AAU9J7X6_9CILI|nr:unnamed protein product [Blepharisma stoltei]
MRRQKRFGCRSGNTIKKCPTCSFTVYSIISGESNFASGCVPSDSEEIKIKKNDNYARRKYQAHNLRSKNQFGYCNHSHKQYNKVEDKMRRSYWDNKDIRIDIKETDKNIKLFKLQKFEHPLELVS